MRTRSPFVSLLLALVTVGLLFATLSVPDEGALVPEASSPPVATQVDPAGEQVLEDDIVLAWRRRPGHVGIKARYHAFYQVLQADINPTLPGSKSYRVVLKVKHQGKWRRCAATRTENINYHYYFTRGRLPHEVAFFFPVNELCPGPPKAAKKYRVVVPAQHGFERTITKVFPAP